MITEDYVSFETAKLLKEKGFDEFCRAHYDITDGSLYYEKVEVEASGCEMHNSVLAPTLQMAMKWLRKSYNITVLPGVRIPHAICGKIEAYWAGIWYVPKNNGGALCFTSPTPENGYSSFEEACEAGIKYSLEHLI